MKTQRTFKPGDFCRFTPEEIKKIIALLKANGHSVYHDLDGIPNGKSDITSKHNVIWCDQNGELGSSIDVNSYCKSELSRHSFLVTALRLNEGDGMRSDMSTPEQRRHIAEVLKNLGVKTGELTNVKTIGVGLNFNNTEICFFGTRDSEINHIPYSDWCKRLNETPNHIPEAEEKVDLKRFCMGIINQLFDLAEVPVEKRQSINDVSDEYLLNQISELLGRNTPTLPDGTTVDLSKPLECRNKDAVNWMDIFHYIGITSDGEYMVETKNGALHSFDFIRNKPEPEFKPGDKVWFKHDIIENWEFGIIDEDGDVCYPVSKVKVIGKVTIRPAFIDGVAQFPPFD